MENLVDLAQASRVVSPEDLAIAFTAYRINASRPPLRRNMGWNSRHHQLVVEFPCFDLLPSGGRLVLEQPVNIKHRERPQDNGYFEHNHPDAMVRLETRADVSHSHVPVFERKYRLEDMIARLSLAPGFSTLKIISFQVAGQVVHRFQLQTNWVTAQTQALFSHEMQNFDASEYEWNLIRERGSHELWVKLLDTHMNRATDFSFLQVHERLKQHDVTMAECDMQILAPLWDTEPFQSANNVLKLRMRKLQQFELDSVQDLYELPCGHQFMTNDTHLMVVMTEEDCRNAKCPRCNQTILSSDEDFIRLAIVHDRRVREQKKRDEKTWEQLKVNFELDIDGQARDTNGNFPISCKDFRQALLDARKSFHLPATTMAHEINFVNYPETRYIRDMLLKLLTADYQPMTVSGELTLGLLIEFASNALKHYFGGVVAGNIPNDDVWTTLPPTYRHFLLAWFTRTLHLNYARFKQTWQNVAHAMEGLRVQTPADDSYRLGYKLDLSFMGKRGKKEDNTTTGVERESGGGNDVVRYCPEEGDWKKVVQQFE